MNALIVTESYASRWLITCYVNFTSVKTCTHTHTHTCTCMPKLVQVRTRGIKENLLGLRYRGKSRYREVREIGMFSIFVDLSCSKESEHREYIFFYLIYTHVLIKGNEQNKYERKTGCGGTFLDSWSEKFSLKR